MSRLAAAACLLALSASLARGLDCANPATTADMITCGGRDLDAADRELNQVYDETMGLVRKRAADWPEAAGNLRAAQRAWVVFRDANCTWVAGAMEGGTGQPVLEISCRSEMTRARTKELRETAKPYR